MDFSECGGGEWVEASTLSNLPGMVGTPEYGEGRKPSPSRTIQGRERPYDVRCHGNPEDRKAANRTILLIHRRRGEEGSDTEGSTWWSRSQNMVRGVKSRYSGPRTP